MRIRFRQVAALRDRIGRSCEAFGGPWTPQSFNRCVGQGRRGGRPARALLSLDPLGRLPEPTGYAPPRKQRKPGTAPRGRRAPVTRGWGDSHVEAALRPPGGAAGLRLRGRGRGWVKWVVARAPGPALGPGQGRRVRPSFATSNEGRTREDSFTPGRGQAPARGASWEPGARSPAPAGRLVGAVPAGRLVGARRPPGASSEPCPPGLDRARRPVDPTLRLTRRPSGTRRSASPGPHLNDRRAFGTPPRRLDHLEAGDRIGERHGRRRSLADCGDHALVEGEIAPRLGL